MRRLKIFLVLLIVSFTALAQKNEETNFSINYSSPQNYTIAGIEVRGIRYLDTNVLMQISGLAVGDGITVPGDDITNAIKKLWGHQMFSDVRIEADRIVDDKIWLVIYLQERPKLSDVNFFGVSKSEKEDIGKRVLLLKGSQVTDNQLNHAERIIQSIFHEKGYFNTEVNIVQRDDPNEANSVILDIHVDKKEKVRVAEINFHGANALKSSALDRAMKKTNAKKMRNILRTKKFLEEKYEEDKVSLIGKYNERGYRDATIVADSITPLPKNRVRLDIWLDEGDKYYFGDVRWMGNTVYSSQYLDRVLGVKKGDVFDQKLLDKRLTSDETAVSNLYLDHGYLFFQLEPVEVRVENDTIDYEMRIYEGALATINKVIIEGNTKTHEHVARRELRTYPGDLFSKSEIIRSARELANVGHFDAESINPLPIPHPEDGTVDIKYQLQEKSNDQIELSGGWGANTFVGTLGLRFSNFSVRNVFNKDAWKPLPTGDGQTLALRAQTSGKFFQSYSFSFMEPWLGGKKPNSLSASFTLSRSDYSANSVYSAMGSSTGKQLQVTTALALGYGYRLKWPDDYFSLYHELSLEYYKLQNMSDYYFFLAGDDVQSGKGGFNNLSFKTAFARNSIDNPLFPRRGSEMSISLQLTVPYSIFNSKNYASSNITAQERYRWIEYHKWKLKGDWYTPLTEDGNLVFHTKFEYGFLGYFDKNLRSPFGRFRVGGSGMSGYNLYGSEIVSLRGYEDYSLSPSTGSNMYEKLSLELRYPITLKPSATIYALAFMDAGNAWMTFESFDPFWLKRSAGAGVRIFLPMFGLMGIDWGYGFDDANFGGSQFHFVIGQQF